MINCAHPTHFADALPQGDARDGGSRLCARTHRVSATRSATRPRSSTPATPAILWPATLHSARTASCTRCPRRLLRHRHLPHHSDLRRLARGRSNRRRTVTFRRGSPSASPTADAVRPERLERSADRRRDVGLAARDRLKRGDLATWARARSVDALSMLAGQDAIRRVDLVPIRYGRMAASPWSFYRGAAAVMASDLASRPNTGLTVQLCGDAHLLNFGLWATPERQLSFDLRDFDETLPGPFEWDVSRLVASVVVLARENGLTESVADRAVADCLRAYRQRIAEVRALDAARDLVRPHHRRAADRALQAGRAGAGHLAHQEEGAEAHDQPAGLGRPAGAAGRRRQAASVVASAGATAVRYCSVCSSHCTPRSMAYRSPRPGSRVGK